MLCIFTKFLFGVHLSFAAGLNSVRLALSVRLRITVQKNCPTRPGARRHGDCYDYVPDGFFRLRQSTVHLLSVLIKGL